MDSPWRNRRQRGGRRAVAAVAAVRDTEMPSVSAGDGPWALWDLHGPWPLSAHVMQEHLLQDSFKSLSSSWSQDTPTAAGHASKEAHQSGEFPRVQVLVFGAIVHWGAPGLWSQGAEGTLGSLGFGSSVPGLLGSLFPGEECWCAALRLQVLGPG